jgi:hypothetical protein
MRNKILLVVTYIENKHSANYALGGAGEIHLKKIKIIFTHLFTNDMCSQNPYSRPRNPVVPLNTVLIPLRQVNGYKCHPIQIPF